MVIYQKTMSLCAVPEFTVMVGTTSGTVLDTIDVIMVMYHFMEQGGGDILNGPGQSSRADVDLVVSSPLGDPGVIPE